MRTSTRDLVVKHYVELGGKRAIRRRPRGAVIVTRAQANNTTGEMWEYCRRVEGKGTLEDPVNLAR